MKPSTRFLILLASVGILPAQTTEQIRSQIAAVSDPARHDQAVAWLRSKRVAAHDLLFAELDAGADRRRHAITGITALAASMTNRLPDYVRWLEQSNELRGTEELQALEMLLRHADEDQRDHVRGSVVTLCREAPFNPRALPGPHGILPRRLRANGLQDSRRLAAGKAMARLDLGAEASLEQLLAALESSQGCVRLAALGELATRPALPPAAIQALFKALSSRHHPGHLSFEFDQQQGMTTVAVSNVIQLQAARLLRKIALNDRRVHAALFKILANGDAEERSRALVEIGMLGPIAQNQVKYVVRALRDDDPLVVREAIVVLGLIGLPAESEVPTRAQWREKLRAKKPDVRREAVEALSWNGPSIADAWRLLRNLTKHEDVQIARRARATLDRLEEDRK